MDGKTKTIAGIALVVVVLSSAFIAAPTLASNGADNGDQVRDQERLRTHDMSCDGDRLQTQERQRLRIQDCSCDGDPLGTQNQEKLRTQNQACNGECNGYCQGAQYGANAEHSNSGNLERNRSQHGRGNSGL